MSRVTEIARILGCTESNVCYLLRRGRIKGKKTSAGWMVSDEAVQEYLASPKVQLHPIKLKLHKGQKFGYWTVLNPDAERSKSGQRTALVRCICGKTKRVSIIDLLYGHSRSCGCRRAENSSRPLKKSLKASVLYKTIHIGKTKKEYLNRYFPVRYSFFHLKEKNKPIPSPLN